MIITYFECVFADIGIERAERMPGSNEFFHIIS
jgi:hypothetical protein